MAKLTLADTASGYNLAPLNNNFTLIETEFQDKVLYRNNPAGEPNHMEQELDMNNNRVFNLPDALTGTEAIPLGQTQRLINAASSGLIARLRETRKIAAAGQTVFNLADVTYVPGVNNLQVYVNGVAQVPGIDYSETDSDTITFLSGLQSGDAVDVYVNDATTNNVTDAQNVQYNQTSNVKLELDSQQAEINQRTIFVGSVAEGISGLSLPDGTPVIALNFRAGTAQFKNPAGRQNLIFSASASKSTHGILGWSPTVPSVSNQSGATLWERIANYLAGTGETDPGGTGLFVINESIINFEMYGAIGDGTAIDHASCQAAFNSKKPIHAIAATYNLGADYVYQHPRTTFIGVSNEKTLFISSNTKATFTYADDAGVSDRTLKDQTQGCVSRSFGVENTGGGFAYAHIGVWKSDVAHIKASRSTDPGAGFRTGIGCVFSGVDKTGIVRGQYYTNAQNIEAEYYNDGIIVGPLANVNHWSDFRAFYNDRHGITNDNGTLLGYTNNTTPAPQIVFNGITSEINGVSQFRADPSTVKMALFGECYIGGGGTATGFLIEGGNLFDHTTTTYDNCSPNWNVATAAKVWHLGDSTTAVPIEQIQGVNRGTLKSSLSAPALYTAALARYETAFPQLLTITKTITADGSSPTASANITFSDYPDLPANLRVSSILGVVCLGTPAGGANNATVNTGISGLNINTDGTTTDTVFSVHVRNVDNVNLGVGDHTIMVTLMISGG